MTPDTETAADFTIELAERIAKLEEAADQIVAAIADMKDHVGGHRQSNIADELGVIL